jgi:hypothetical protein
MSDAEVLRLVEEMEGLLESDPATLDADLIANWHQQFLSACASAEKGPAWPETVLRARVVAGRVDGLVTVLNKQKDALKIEMEAQAVGRRALQAYKPQSR